jgi:O-antigen ligase
LAAKNARLFDCTILGVPLNSTFYFLAISVLTASLLLGGGTRSGLLSDVLLQLFCLPVLLIAAAQVLFPRPDPAIPGATLPGPAASAHTPQSARPPELRRLAFLLGFITLCCLLPLLQVLPLPQGWWTMLPGREPVRAAFGHLAAPVPDWLPLSISPHTTWQSLLALLPPLAVFFCVIQLSGAQRRRVSVALLAMALINVFLGLVQLMQGPGSILRFFEITNDLEAVGFFANRNHFSALLYCAIILAAAWALELTRSFEALPPERRFEPGSILPLMAIFTLAVALMAAQSMTRSRAGLILTIIAVIGAFALALPERRRGKRSGMSARILVGTIALSTFMAVQLSLYRILERFASDPMADPRVVIARNTIAAAKSYMPFGSGIGTFVPVYAMFEKPADVLSGVYVNRAHNDFLEVWLETGVIGPALFAVFLMWLLVRAVKVWRPARSGRAIDHALARAGVLVIALLIAHSVSDYPLRTGGLMAVFAFAAALLVPPPAGADAAEQAIDAAAIAEAARSERRAQRRAVTIAAKAQALKGPPAPQPAGAGLAAGKGLPKAFPKPTAASPIPAPGNHQTWPNQPVGAVKPAEWPEAWRKAPPAPKQRADVTTTPAGPVVTAAAAPVSDRQPDQAAPPPLPAPPLSPKPPKDPDPA